MAQVSCFRRLRLVSVVVVVTLVSATLSRPSASQSVPRYDGETIFRGVFFGTGIVAQQVLSDIWDRPQMASYALLANTSPRARAAQDEIVASLRAADPRFFERFAVETSSGDHLRVEAALAEGTKLLRRFAEARTGPIDITRLQSLSAETDVQIQVETYGWAYFWVYVAAFLVVFG